MGCTIRKQSCEEETYLIELQEALCLHKHTSEELDLHLRKFTLNSTRLNQSQLIDFLNALNLITWDTRKQTMSFYELYQAEPGKFLFRPLLITVILLGNSPSHVKGRLIFEAFDSNNSKNLSLNTFYELVDLILDISLEKLPKLAQFKYQSLDIISNYTVNLTSQRLKARDRMVKLFVPVELSSTDRVLKDEFILSCYKEEPASQLLTPEGVRSFVGVMGR